MPLDQFLPKQTKTQTATPQAPAGLSKFLPKQPSTMDRLETDLETSLQTAPGPPLLRKYAPMLVRGASALAPPGWIGAGVGGGAELLAQTLEGRDEYNMAQVAAQSALGAIPFGKITSIAKTALKGGTMAAGGALLTQQAETGLHVPTESDLSNVALAGTIGGLTGGVLAKYFAKAPAKALREPSVDAPAMVRQAAAAQAGADIQPPRRVFVTKPGEELYNAEIPQAGRIPKANTVNVNLEQFGGADNPIAKGINDIIQENTGFRAQRRDVQSWARAQALADRVKVEVKTLRPGTTLNDFEFQAYGDALSTIMDKQQSLAAKIAEGSASETEKIAFLSAKEDAAALTASYVGAAAEAGRALNIQKSLKRIVESKDVILMRKALEASGDDVDALAKEFAALPDDPIARYEWLRSKHQATVGDTARSYFYANILSGLKTHERNIIGNAMNTVFNVASHPFAVAADATRSAVTGTERTVFMGELPKKVVGAAVGIPRAFKDLTFALQHGFSPEALSMLDQPIRRELAGGGANPFNWPGRALEAADAFFAGVVKHQELYSLAYASAKAEAKKLPSAQQSQFIQDRMADLVTDKTADNPLWRKASESAERYLFREDPGKVAHIVMLLKKEIPMIDFVVPFVKVPANIMKQGVQASPLGFASQAARQGGRLGAEAQGRAMLGSAVLFPLAWYAANGNISGSGPRDPASRAALMESGWRPNSIRIGDAWYSYQTMQPIAAPLAAVANAFDAWREEGAKAEDAPQFAANVLFRTINSVLDQSFLSGMSSLLEALNDPDRYANTFLRNIASGLVPFSGMQRNVAQGIDPVQRQPEGLAESVMSNIPGLSDQVRPRLDRFGEDVVRPGNTFMRGMSAVEVSPVVQDPVAQELDRLGVKLTLPTADIKDRGQKVELSREEELAFRREKGRSIRDSLERIVNNPAYARLPDDIKYTLLDSAISRARQQTTSRQRTLARAKRIVSERP